MYWGAVKVCSPRSTDVMPYAGVVSVVGTLPPIVTTDCPNEFFSSTAVPGLPCPI